MWIITVFDCLQFKLTGQQLLTCPGWSYMYFTKKLYTKMPKVFCNCCFLPVVVQYVPLMFMKILHSNHTIIHNTDILAEHMVVKSWIHGVNMIYVQCWVWNECGVFIHCTYTSSIGKEEVCSLRILYCWVWFVVNLQLYSSISNAVSQNYMHKVT